ncbi:MAG: NADPH dehydrogenase NamA [Firmicutes bacterium]|nr:NADPH dehydrogenase NamA [Bacillota bacterium]
MLFSPYQLKGITLKNRIVMAPMCTYSCMTEDGKVAPWHLVHYGSRAIGQPGMIIVEATAVTPRGRISVNDLGLWDDSQISGMQELVATIHSENCVAAVQLNHAGRKAVVGEPGLAPSPLAFSTDYPRPEELNIDQIETIIGQFQAAARRAKSAGFDVIELHGAHGYLLNQFLSPLTNRRTDEYGSTPEKRFRLLAQITEAVQAVWDGPLMVRLSVEEYHSEGNGPDETAYNVECLQALGVDMIDCSSGGVHPARVPHYPGYQVPYAERFRREFGIATGAVGLIISPLHAEEILQNGRADLVLLGRELLRNPNWPIYAARELGAEIKIPRQYQRGW